MNHNIQVGRESVKIDIPGYMSHDLLTFRRFLGASTCIPSM